MYVIMIGLVSDLLTDSFLFPFSVEANKANSVLIIVDWIM